MRTRRNSGLWVLGAMALLALTLTGCRAFQPESVIVNKAPETYIIGAPEEDGGGYYHFHVYWYGVDVDGQVTRFVWALTDTTVQDPRTTDDEEDVRFNPALDATTLAIGHYTTRTDSVFNFTINQGVNISYDKTFHLVAIDDKGAFDRTPARLHFFTNTLGNPTLRFFRIEGTTRIPLAMGQVDTVGFGNQYQISWEGSSPNIRGFDPVALAAVDTVPPRDDGLFGYKWQILGDLGGSCVPTLTDCWHPRKFNEATGDSFSFFGNQTTLLFMNNGSSNTNPFMELLPSGQVDLEINSIDVAGIEVADFMRSVSFIVNYDPQTMMVDGFDTEHPDDPQEYPFYVRLNDPARERHPFHAGDRIPDRTYVVVKALGRDDLRDSKLDPDFGVAFTGYVTGIRHNFFGGDFSFSTGASVINYEPTWPAECETCWYADTLGFLVEPRTQFTVNMQAIDEHARRDGSPASLSFEVGFPPCIQCIETLPRAAMTSHYGPDVACYDGESSHVCFDGEDSYKITTLPGHTNDADALEYVGQAYTLVNKATGFTQTLVDTTGLSASNYVVDARLYRMTVLLHGKDDAREAWNSPVNRIMAWKYQVDYDCDPYNQIKDGGGNDGLNEPTWGILGNTNSGLAVDTATGVWKLSVNIAVPTQLLSAGPTTYRYILRSIVGNDEALVESIFQATTRQSGHGTIRAVALDQTSCGFKPIRPAQYNFFEHVRPPSSGLPSFLLNPTWRTCKLETYLDVKQGLDLSQTAMSSNEGIPAVKHFRITFQTPEGDFECSDSTGF